MSFFSEESLWSDELPDSPDTEYSDDSQLSVDYPDELDLSDSDSFESLNSPGSSSSSGLSVESADSPPWSLIERHPFALDEKHPSLSDPRFGLGEWETFAQPPIRHPNLNELVRLRNSFNKPKTCQICFSEGLCYYDSLTKQPIMLHNLRAYHVPFATLFDSLPSDSVWMAPCMNSSHLQCLKCWYRLATQLHSLGCHCVVTTTTSTNSTETTDSMDSTSSTNLLTFCRGPEVQLPLSALEFIVSFDEYDQVYFQLQRHLPQSISKHWNHYLFTARTKRQMVFPPLLETYQLEQHVPDILKQFQIYQTSTKLVTFCKECDMAIEKTAQCNCLSHCGLDICYMCGYTDVTILEKHWQSCPRYDYLNTLPLEARLKCEENKCVTLEKACSLVGHQPMIENYHKYRQKLHVLGLWHSLSETIQRKVQAQMTPELKAWLSGFLISDEHV